MDECNKVIFFLNALEPSSLNRKIEKLQDRVPAPDLDQCIWLEGKFCGIQFVNKGEIWPTKPPAA